MKRTALFTLFMLIAFATSAFAFDPETGCVKCHGSKDEMTKLGYPQLYLDPATVDKEVNMGGIECSECHMGNPKGLTADEAHKGMPRPYYAAVGKNHKMQAVSRSITNFAPISPKGEKRIGLLNAKPDPDKAAQLGIKNISTLFYHDRDPETHAYSPNVANATCGKCHVKETKDYNESGMGLNKTQRAFTNWTQSVPGPQNCGPWFGDEENFEKIKNETGVPYTSAMDKASNRSCNVCHASCNDCHYQGQKKTPGRHTFTKKIEPLTCYGGGRGSICHAGPNDRRRGAGYIREEFAFPVNELHSDVHSKAGVSCNDCHTIKNHQYAHLGAEDARSSCNKCHQEIVSAVKESNHGSVDCSSCHIKEVGAYQFTFWGPGMTAGLPNVYTKYKEYYGIRSLPTLIRHPETKLWVPVKPYPMAALNIKEDVKKTKLMVRKIEPTTIKGKTAIGEPESFVVQRAANEVNDFYIINGTFDMLKQNSKMLAWVQMDKMSHAIGKARDCASCHSSHDQVATSWYTFELENAAEKPFNGSYTIRATKKGLFFENFQSETPAPAKGRTTEEFAPHLVSGNVWDAKGIDFSIPFDEKRVAGEKGKADLLYAKLHSMKQQFAKDAEKMKKIGVIQAVLAHNPAKAEAMMAAFQ